MLFIHEHVQRILDSVEAQILSKTPTHRPTWKPFQSHPSSPTASIGSFLNERADEIQTYGQKLPELILWPYPFLKVGVAMIWKWILFWSIGLLLLTWVGGWVVPFFANLQPTLVKVLIWLPILVATLWAVFPVPSMYAHGGVRQSDIEPLLYYVEANPSLCTKAALGALQEALKVMEEPVKRRLLGYRAFATLAWGGSMYLFLKPIDAMFDFVKQGKPVSPLEMQQAMLYLAVTIVAFGLAQGLITAYELAVFRVYRTVQFGCLEALCRLDEKACEAAT